jgi:hypothetical protein
MRVSANSRAEPFFQRISDVRGAGELFCYLFRLTHSGFSYHEFFGEYFSLFTHQDGPMSYIEGSIGLAKMNYGCWICFKLFLSREFLPCGEGN